MSVTSETAQTVGFKGRMMTLTVLEVRETDLARIDAALGRQLERSPAFFESMPVLLSLPAGPIDVAAVVRLLRSHALVPVAILGRHSEHADSARAAGLGVLSDERQPRGQSESRPQRQPTRVIDTPVRSGQQVYARGTDLVVTAAVSEGAEVLADGHIHVYGALRGRALAGASGDAGARIFCRRFEAELVAVAGNYKVAEDMDEVLRGKAVQVRMEGDNLLMDLQE